MHPQYKEYLESQSDKYVAKRFSMAYILFSVANTYVEEATDRLAQYDLVHKKIKTTTNNLMQSFDAYHKTMAQLMQVDDKEARKELGTELCDDYDVMKAACDKFMEGEQ